MSYTYRCHAPHGPVRYATPEEKREMHFIECNVEIWTKCMFCTFDEVSRVKSPDDGVLMLYHPRLDKEDLLGVALSQGMSEVVQHFATHCRETVRAYDFRVYSNKYISLACKNDNIEMVKLLMDPGIGNLNADDITTYYTRPRELVPISALMYAAKNDCLRIVKFFTDEGFITRDDARIALGQFKENQIDDNSCSRLLRKLTH